MNGKLDYHIISIMFRLPKKYLIAIASGIGVASTSIWYSNLPKKVTGSPFDNAISRHVRFNDVKSKINLDITLFQYQTCPFCSKVRTYLDYNGINYDVVEVNSVSQRQIKWTEYHKVPIALVKNNGKLVQLNDSSLIISVLESFKSAPDNGLSKFVDFYPPFDTVDQRGRPKVDYYNKYQIMSGRPSVDADYEKNEIKWRKWVDEDFVHTLAPNIYRTPSEALEAFNYVSECGEWDENFGRLQSRLVVYVGAAFMYVIGKVLKRRHRLHDDVRQSLFEGARVWVAAVGKADFQGGARPSLADLAVYGVLSSIEGVSTFRELMHNNVEMRAWFYRTRACLASAGLAAVRSS